MLNQNRVKLGDLLLQVGKITEEQLKQALNQQKVTGKKLGQVLVEIGYLTEHDIIEVLEFQLGIPHIRLDKYFIDPEVPRLISEKLAKRYSFLFYRLEEAFFLLYPSFPVF